MSVQFDIVGHEWPENQYGYREPPAAMFVQISHDNAQDFLHWARFPDTRLYGELPARELAALLRRRLWPQRRMQDDSGIPACVDRTPGIATFIDCGRKPGRLAAYAERLLALAEFAGDRTIHWY
jgi:hypothetical protein